MPKIESLDVHGLNLGRIETRADGSHSGPTDAWMLVALGQIVRELEKLNKLLHCHNALEIPPLLRQIEKNTRKPKRKKATRIKLRMVA